jgi:hypothetical protein
MFRKTLLLAMAAGALTVSACDTPTSSGETARVTVLLTDAPLKYLESAVVEIGRIEILPVGGPPIVISADGGTYDLLKLQDGVTAELGFADMDPGRYHQLRMIVSRVTLTLADDYEFNDGSSSRDIAVPSGAESGIKIKLTAADGKNGPGVDIRPGETVLVVDFDVSQNFVMQGSADTSAGIEGFLFTPLLRAAVKDVAGSIAGSVEAPSGVDTEGMQVTATLEGAEEGTVSATATVKDDGTFKLFFLPPGTYAVTVAAGDVPENHTANTVQKAVGEAEDVTGVELVIAADG